MINVRELDIVTNGIGAPAPTSDLSTGKTIIATGLTGVLVIEGSADGEFFCPVATVSKEVEPIEVVATHMRVDAKQGSATSVRIVAEQSRIRAVRTLVSEPPGEILDVSSFGPEMSFYINKTCDP